MAARVLIRRAQPLLAARTAVPAAGLLRPAPAPARARAAATQPQARGGRVQAAAPEATPLGDRLFIQGRHLKVTDAIRDHVEEKVYHALSHFHAHSNGAVRKVDVKLSTRGGASHRTKGEPLQKVELTVRTALGLVRAEEMEEDMYKAVDMCCHKLERKLRKMKEKATSKGKWAGHGSNHRQRRDDFLDDVGYSMDSTSISMDSLDGLSEEYARGAEALVTGVVPDEVKRVKELEADVMSVAEAIENIKMIDHDFYVFRDQDTREVQIIYKRHDVGYGLLIPNL